LPIKADLHVHTCYSRDAITTLKDLILYSKKRGLNAVAVTDHDTLEGTLKVKKANGLTLIPGTEVTTRNGHVLALNLTMPIPKGFELAETVERIHEANGIAIAPHPSAFLKSSLGSGALQKSVKMDAVEVINSSAFPFFLSTQLGRRLATRLNLPQTAGSDSHIPETIGLAYTIIDANPNVEDIIDAIKRGFTVPYGRSVPIRLRFKKIVAKKRGEECFLQNFSS